MSSVELEEHSTQEVRDHLPALGVTVLFCSGALILSRLPLLAIDNREAGRCQGI